MPRNIGIPSVFVPIRTDTFDAFGTRIIGIVFNHSFVSSAEPTYTPSGTPLPAAGIQFPSRAECLAASSRERKLGHHTTA